MNKRTHPLPSTCLQRGAAAVEFAFILPLLLLLFSGMVEYGRAMWHYDALAKGARDAARYLSTVPAVSLGAASSLTGACDYNNTAKSSAYLPAYCFVENAADKAGVAGLTADDITVTCAPKSCDAAEFPSDVTTVTVAIGYPFKIGGWIPVFGPAPGESSSPMEVTLSPHV